MNSRKTLSSFMSMFKLRIDLLLQKKTYNDIEILTLINYYNVIEYYLENPKNIDKKINIISQSNPSEEGNCEEEIKELSVEKQTEFLIENQNKLMKIQKQCQDAKQQLEELTSISSTNKCENKKELEIKQLKEKIYELEKENIGINNLIER